MSDKQARVAAIDYGRARIGLAVADELGILASPRPFVPARPPQRALRQLVQLLRDEGIGLVLLGLPYNMNGSLGSSAERVQKFGAELQAASGVPIEYVDERLSTIEAHGRLREAGIDARAARSRVDSAAAAILLQSFLDGKRRD